MSQHSNAEACGSLFEPLHRPPEPVPPRRGRRTRSGLTSTLVLAVMLLSACMTKRDVYFVPEIPVPSQFRQAMTPTTEPALADAADEALGSHVRFMEDMLAQWWRVLGSQELDALMDRAIANNADLRIATLRIVQAQARSEQARANELPVITVPYEARIESPASSSGCILTGQSGSVSSPLCASLRADLRLDVWGERRALTESSQMQLWRAIYQRDDVRRTVVAGVASQYVEYLSLNDRMRVARETEIVLRGMLDAVSVRLKAGDATITDLEQQRAAVYSAQAAIPGLELQRENAINSLAQMLGATPGMLALSHRGMDSLNFPRVLPGVPANLLLRRPDVRAVEARLLAADADIDVARTRLLPSVDLASQAGFGTLASSSLLQPHTLAWNLIANLSATIFDSGKRTNEVVFARALHEELVETYVRVLYFAIRETEDAIATVQMNAKRLGAQGAATKAAKRAWDHSLEAYRGGAIDYLTLIDTERTYHRNLDEYHRVSMERHKGLVSLFSSLGGGIAKDSPAPARGDPPGDIVGDFAMRAAAQAPIQFSPAVNEGAGESLFWLVELAGLQDRTGVTHVWRDLVNRFPDLMSERILLPRMQGQVAGARTESAAWYRTFIARFATLKAAKDFCDRLSVSLVRCKALRSDSPAYQDALESAPSESARAVETPVAAIGGAPARIAPATTQTPRAAQMSVASLDSASSQPAGLSRQQGPTAGPLGAAPTAPVALPLTPAFANAPPGLAAVQQSIITPEYFHALLAVPVEMRTAPGTQSTAPAQEPVDKVPAPAKLAYAVQLATLVSEVEAQASSRAWSRKGYKTYLYAVASPGGFQYTVRTGLYPNSRQATARAAKIQDNERAHVVPVPVMLDSAGHPAPVVATSLR